MPVFPRGDGSKDGSASWSGSMRAVAERLCRRFLPCVLIWEPLSPLFHEDAQILGAYQAAEKVLEGVKVVPSTAKSRTCLQ
jgi:hypothetical protein